MRLFVRFLRSQLWAYAVFAGLTFTTTDLWSQNSPKPLLVEEVSGLLRSGVSSKRILDIARERCLAFTLEPSALAALRAAGATEQLLVSLNSVCGPAVEPPAQVVGDSEDPTPKPPVKTGRRPARAPRTWRIVAGVAASRFWPLEMDTESERVAFAGLSGLPTIELGFSTPTYGVRARYSTVTGPGDPQPALGEMASLELTTPLDQSLYGFVGMALRMNEETDLNIFTPVGGIGIALHPRGLPAWITVETNLYGGGFDAFYNFERGESEWVKRAPAFELNAGVRLVM